MNDILRISTLLGLTALLAGCALREPEPLALFTPTGEPIAGAAAAPVDPMPGASAAVGAPDVVAAPDPAVEEVASANAGPPVNGITVATLGDATEPGMWIETPFVQVERPGWVISESGRIVELTLRPSGGALGSGSRISLAAMQALGLNLTDLATLTVRAGP